MNKNRENMPSGNHQKILEESSWPVAVFAHNESKNIIACLESLKKASDTHPIDIYVLENGSTDNTAALVREYQRDNPNVHLVDIAIADKCNAWNCFVYECGIEGEIVFFIDGDCTASARSFQFMREALTEGVLAVAALPGSGRNREDNVQRINAYKEFWGCLYALSNDFLTRFRADNLRLVRGLIGDDGHLNFLVKTDFDSKDVWNNANVAIAENAFFYFKSFSYCSLNDIVRYYKRKMNYSLRSLQAQIMRKFIRTYGIKTIPGNMNEIYQKVDLPSFRIKFNSDIIIDYLAYKKLKNAYKTIKENSAQK